MTESGYRLRRNDAGLTERERQVYGLFLAGEHSQSVIARTLRITKQRVGQITGVLVDKGLLKPHGSKYIPTTKADIESVRMWMERWKVTRDNATYGGDPERIHARRIVADNGSGYRYDVTATFEVDETGQAVVAVMSPWQRVWTLQPGSVQSVPYLYEKFGRPNESRPYWPEVIGLIQTISLAVGCEHMLESIADHKVGDL